MPKTKHVINVTCLTVKRQQKKRQSFNVDVDLKVAFEVFYMQQEAQHRFQCNSGKINLYTWKRTNHESICNVTNFSQMVKGTVNKQTYYYYY